MKFTKHTSVALLSATLLTTVVACSKQNDTATTTQKKCYFLKSYTQF